MNVWSPQSKKKKIKSGRRQTAVGYIHALPPAPSGTVVSLFCAVGRVLIVCRGRADAFRWVAHFVLGRDSAPPGHFICVVCPTVPGAASIYLFLFFESSNQSNLLRLLGFRPPVASTGPSPPLPIEKVPRGGGDFDLSLIGASADTKLHTYSYRQQKNIAKPWIA